MRSRILLPVLCVVLLAGAGACADDDADGEDAPTTTDGDASPTGGGDETGEDGGEAASGDGSGTLTIGGTTYELDQVWCDPFEDGRQWMAFDREDFAAGIQIRSSNEPPRYRIEVDLEDNARVWRYSPLGGPETDDSIAVREAIDASDDHIRGEGITVSPVDENSGDVDETIAFDLTC